MKYDSEFGLYVATGEKLNTFCKRLISKRDAKKRNVVGMYGEQTIYVTENDTVDTLVYKYNESEKVEKKNRKKRRGSNNLFLNASGYADPTAFLAIKHLEDERKKEGK